MAHFLLLFAFLILPAAEDWEKEYTKNSISVYTRPVAGSNFKSAKAETTYPQSMQLLQQLLLNPGNYNELINNCESAKLVKSIDQQNFIAYLTFDSPWPFKSRDVYIRFSAAMQNDRLTIQLEDEKSYASESGYVRMDNLKGEWLINSAEGGTAVSFSFLMDPGGSISSWMVNKKADEVVYNILLNIQNQL